MIDNNLIFDGSLNTGLTAPTGAAIATTRQSTNVIDLGVARDLGAGDVLEIHVDIQQAFTAGGAATLQIAFQGSASSGAGFVNMLLSPVYQLADLIVGSPIFRYELPLNQALNDTNGVLNTPPRYLALNYIVTTGPFTAGTVFSYLNAHQDRTQFWGYPSNYTAPRS